MKTNYFFLIALFFGFSLPSQSQDFWKLTHNAVNNGEAYFTLHNIDNHLWVMAGAAGTDLKIKDSNDGTNFNTQDLPDSLPLSNWFTGPNGLLISHMATSDASFNKLVFIDTKTNPVTLSFHKRADYDPNNSMPNFLVDPNTRQLGPNGEVFISGIWSDDNCATWKVLPIGPVFNAKNINADGSKMFAYSPFGNWRQSTDGGTTWTSSGTGTWQSPKWLSISTNDEMVMWGTNFPSMSMDGGASWTELSNGISAGNYVGHVNSDFDVFMPSSSSAYLLKKGETAWTEVISGIPTPIATGAFTGNDKGWYFLNTNQGFFVHEGDTTGGGGGTTSLNQNEINLSEVSIYPNPATDVLNIQNLKENSEIAVYNLIGELLIKQKSNNQNINLNISDLASGVYFLKTDNVIKGKEILRFVKQ